MRPRKWTDEVLKELTSKYNNLTTFTKENPSAYQIIRTKGKEKLHELTSHMDRLRLPFTEDELRELALKYNNYTEFAKNEASAQVAARLKGKDFYNDITRHFVKLKRDKYSFDEIKTIASKYNHPGEFQDNDSVAYCVARNNGWIDEVTKHMTKKSIYWTLEDVRKIAKKYPTKKEFRSKNKKAYSWSVINLTSEDYDEITNHMEPLGSFAKRMIYVFEYPDNHVYVGLTCNYKKRFDQHMNSINSAVNKHMVKTNLTPIFKKVTDFISIEDAIKMETQMVEQYRKDGWNILNVAKPGSIGSTVLKWTFDEIQKEALKYNSRGEFQKGSPNAYQKALKQNILDDIIKHMGPPLRKRYTYEQIKDVASKYTHLKDFRENHEGEYNASQRRGFFNEVTSHMIKLTHKKTK
jgi:predicted GIY-YIG superfamily endonuclease